MMTDTTLTTIPHNRFINTLFKGHDTAFELTLQHLGGKTTQCYYTVRKTPGIKHWQIFALSPHGKEWFIAQCYDTTLYGMLLTGEPSVATWFYPWWSLFNHFWEYGDSSHIQCHQLGYCKRCGKALTKPEAVLRGYGDDCWNKIHKGE